MYLMIGSGVRQSCIMAPWNFSDERGENGDLGRRGEIADSLASCMQMAWSCVRSRSQVRLEWMRLEHYLGCVLKESGTYSADCSRKVTSGRKITGTTMLLVNAYTLQLNFNYLGVMISMDDSMEEEMANRVLYGRKVRGDYSKIVEREYDVREIKRESYERVVTRTVVYGTET